MWTKTDLEEVTQAIKSLALGKRLVKVSFSNVAGGSHTNEYGQVDLPQLRSLQRDIQDYLESQNDDHTSTYIAVSTKGF